MNKKSLGFLSPMIYGELIVGLPGCGKTTFIREKKAFLSDRNIFTVNLDPGSIEDQDEYDYDIRKKFTTKKMMNDQSIGPNLSVKKILEEFCVEYENVKNIFRDETCYYLIDTPGQVESIKIFENFLIRLERDGIKLITVFLTEINSFTSYQTMAFTYFTVLQTMIALNNTQVNVITKCDLIKKVPLIENIKKIANLQIEIEKIPDFFKMLFEFVEKESLVYFELLEFDKNILSTLQYSIDRGSGYIFEIEDEKKLNECLENVLERDDVFEKYENEITKNQFNEIKIEK